MFKLIALTALIATTSASSSAAADKAAVKKDAASLKAGALKYKSTPGASVLTVDAKTKKSMFLADTTASTFAIAATTKVEDLTCFDCVVSGNTWTTKCAAPAGQTVIKDTSDKQVFDAKLTYEEFIDGVSKCTNSDVCGVDAYTAALFNAKTAVPTGKKGDTPYSWSYGFKTEAAAWDTCTYSAVMPVDATTKKTKWSGGLLLSHVLPADVQAIVQVNNEVAGKAAPYLYNSFTLNKLAVGKTGKIVIPVAESVDVIFTATVAQTAVSTLKIEFLRQTTAQLAAFTLEHGGVIVWVIIGIVVFCLLCVGVVVWKKCFHKTDEFYLEDCYARV